VRIETTGEEQMIVFAMHDDIVTVAVEEPRFGRISTVRLDAEQAGDLAAALRDAVSPESTSRRS